ncbi:UDP-N-acetylmuramoyl-L-alanine--D-glutamate ligase [Desulfurivibrio sp. D14AmB]|uniref:UDP-N-acetylmuramoyl-L-alanine--D-glutamate ligase n=1 Tax=Desulfurivibrio sp. D14AmB TaxID=3374370 RepID=UPI00376EBAA1
MIVPFKATDHVLVVGLGRSGVAAARFLLGLGLKVSVSEGGQAGAAASSAVTWLLERGVHCELDGHSRELFTSVDAIVVSPGVPLDIPALAAARQAGVPIIGELALAPAYLQTPVIAITGTNGKSTVTTLVGELLRANGLQVFVGGNLGVPLCEYLAGPQDADWVVLELSSFQLDSAGAFRPRIGVLLNISPDHLDRYPDYAAYAASKWRIFAHQEGDDYAVINVVDREIKELLERRPLRARTVGFNLGGKPGPDSALADGAWDGGSAAGEPIRLSLSSRGGGQENYELAATALAVEPNRQNAMAAILAARLAGCPPQAIRQGLAAFQPLPHRLALVATIAGVDFYDDSKATNIGAVISALQGMRQPVVLIAGGLDKGGDYRLLLPVLREKVKALVLIGSAREKMAAALASAVLTETAADLPAAVQTAFAQAAPGEAVLLSPACASFDMFSGYAQRGEVFRRAVADLRTVRGGSGPLLRGCPVMAAILL